MNSGIKDADGNHSLSSRRHFMGSAMATAAAFTIVPRAVLGGAGHTSPSRKLNIALVGVGGMGKYNLQLLGDDNIVALCDVDAAYAAPVFAQYPDAKTYTDYRVMLDKQKDIDAVIVATPDHTHAVIAMAAMQSGKHVYVQKPLTRTIHEARTLQEAAAYYKVVTQMGNQGRSSEQVRLICEWIWDGAIGPVREVHTWTNRPPRDWYYDYWGKRPKETQQPPSTLDWDLWLGPSPWRPYHSTYLPSKWRVWWDFGTGSLGDMACHIMDPVWWALKLTSPTTVYGSATLEIEECSPFASVIHYHFPARGDMPPVKVHWYDGGILPERPEELEPGRRMGDNDGGVIFVGDKGKLMCGCYSRNPRLIPETRMREYKVPPKTLERVAVPHEQNWTEACKTGAQPCSHFDVAAPFTEAILLGNIAVRTQRELTWNAEKMEFVNDPEATALVNPPYREGWSL